MTNYKYINYPKIGTVFYEKSKIAKRVVIAIKSPTKIRVAVPRFISFKKAESFVLQKVEWIKKQQIKYSQKINITELANSVSSQDKSNIIQRAERLANKHGFTYNTIKTRKMKTRWGSCTHKNSICLNIGLVVLPDELQDYIIMHELIHTKIKNHSKEFWDELSNFIHEPRALNRKLSLMYGLF